MNHNQILKMIIGKLLVMKDLNKYERIKQLNYWVLAKKHYIIMKKRLKKLLKINMILWKIIKEKSITYTYIIKNLIKKKIDKL